eukprot:3916740-Pyramimonas_sp.AAC.1
MSSHRFNQVLHIAQTSMGAGPVEPDDPDLANRQGSRPHAPTPPLPSSLPAALVTIADWLRTPSVTRALLHAKEVVARSRDRAVS